MIEAENGATVVVFEREDRLVDGRVIHTVLQQRLQHADETLEVHTQVVLEAHIHEVFLFDYVLVEELDICVCGQLKLDGVWPALLAPNQYAEVDVFISLQVLTLRGIVVEFQVAGDQLFEDGRVAILA